MIISVANLKKNILVAVLAVVVSLSVLNVEFPATLVLEVLLIGLVVLSLSSLTLSSLAISFAAISYIVLSYIYASGADNIHLYDFLLIYKVFFYIPLLSLLVGKKYIDVSLVVVLARFFIALFLIDYTLDVFFRDVRRPSVMVENNFELMSLSLLFYLKYLVSGRVTMHEVVAMLGIFVLSGSRSASVILLFVMTAIYFERVDAKKFLGGIVVVILAAYFSIEVFSSRLGYGGLDNIDRFVFLQHFLYEVSGWSLTDLLLGAPRITELSESTCAALSYYQRLFSYSADGSCYSVILHSYILRVIFDHGLLGLVVVTGVLYSFLIRSGYRSRHVTVVLGVILLNSLSVSAFNSIYAMLLIAIYLMVKEPASEDVIGSIRSPEMSIGAKT